MSQSAICNFSEIPEHLTFIGKVHYLRVSQASFYLGELLHEYTHWCITSLIPLDIADVQGHISALVDCGALIVEGNDIIRFSDLAAEAEGLPGSEAVDEYLDKSELYTKEDHQNNINAMFFYGAPVSAFGGSNTTAVSVENAVTKDLEGSELADESVGNSDVSAIDETQQSIDAMINCDAALTFEGSDTTCVSVQTTETEDFESSELVDEFVNKSDINATEDAQNNINTMVDCIAQAAKTEDGNSSDHSDINEDLEDSALADESVNQSDIEESPESSAVFDESVKTDDVDEADIVDEFVTKSNNKEDIEGPGPTIGSDPTDDSVDKSAIKEDLETSDSTHGYSPPDRSVDNSGTKEDLEDPEFIDDLIDDLIDECLDTPDNEKGIEVDDLIDDLLNEFVDKSDINPTSTID